MACDGDLPPRRAARQRVLLARHIDPPRAGAYPDQEGTMHKAMIRSFVVMMFALAGCAVTGDAPSSTGSEGSTGSEPTSQVTEQVVSCPLQCQEAKLVCQGSCPKDPFNPQNDCGCKADYDACLLTCH
jgi:hypothetical protein